MKARKTTKVKLEVCPVFTRWQVRCKRCGALFYVDTEPHSTDEEILELKDTHCGSHPNESSVIELV
jgi:phage terminase large subunit GpA-like protein